MLDGERLDLVERSIAGLQGQVRLLFKRVDALFDEVGEVVEDLEEGKAAHGRVVHQMRQLRVERQLAGVRGELPEAPARRRRWAA